MWGMWELPVAGPRPMPLFLLRIWQSFHSILIPGQEMETQEVDG